eukprot:398706-Amphidinium_carterae.2
MQITRILGGSKVKASHDAPQFHSFARCSCPQRLGYPVRMRKAIRSTKERLKQPTSLAQHNETCKT